MTESITRSVVKRRKAVIYLKRWWTLYLMLLLPIIYFLVFKYAPIANILVAFKNYNITKTVFEMDWAKNNGFEHFIAAFKNRDFLFALRNTVVLNLLDLIMGFPAPILLALILNEVTFKPLKRVTQTIAYMPHFLSWVIISGLAVQLLAPTTGLVNMFLMRMGFDPVPFLNDKTHWVFTYIFLGIWQSVGWNTIIYLAAITSINPEYYEAASVDGAGRFRKMWHITLPGIRSTVVILFILALGNILGSGFDRPFALLNPLVKDVGNVLSTFIYTYGIRSGKVAMTTAVGLFQSVVSVIFVLTANKLARQVGERGLW